MCLSLIAGQKKYNSETHRTKVSKTQLRDKEIAWDIPYFAKSLKYNSLDETFHLLFDSELENLIDDTAKIRIGYKCLESDESLLSSYFLSKVKLHEWMTADRNLETDRLGNLYVTGFHILWNRENARKFKNHNHMSGSIYKVEYKDVHGCGFDGDGTEVVLASKMRVIGKVS